MEGNDWIRWEGGTKVKKINKRCTINERQQRAWKRDLKSREGGEILREREAGRSVAARDTMRML